MSNPFRKELERLNADGDKAEIGRLKQENEKLRRLIALSFMAGSRLGHDDGYDGERFDEWLKDTLDKREFVQ